MLKVGAPPWMGLTPLKFVGNPMSKGKTLSSRL